MECKVTSKASCEVCGSKISVASLGKTQEASDMIAQDIADNHCKEGKGGQVKQVRSWDITSTVIKKPKVDMNDYSELL